MANPDLTPEALKRLVERLSGLATLRQHAVNTMPRGFLAQAQAKAVADIGTLTEAAASISALTAERESCDLDRALLSDDFRITQQLEIENLRRAERAEAKLREIAEICVPRVTEHSSAGWEGECRARGKLLDRIATIARSTSQGGEG